MFVFQSIASIGDGQDQDGWLVTVSDISGMLSPVLRSELKFFKLEGSPLNIIVQYLIN